MKPEEALRISAALQAVGRPIAYYPVFAHVLGGVKAAIFISQFLYWEGKQKDAEGWIYKTQAEIEKETGLTRTEQENARGILRGRGILEETRRGVPARLFFRFNWVVLDEAVTAYNSGQEKEPAKESKPEQKHEPITYRFKTVFDEEYIKPGANSQVHYTTPYVWGKESGKDWGQVKQLTILVRELITQRRAKTNDVTPVTDDDCLSAFQFIISNMNDYHRSRNFSPALLTSNFNRIIQDLANEHTKGNRTGKNVGDTAGAYV